MTSTIVIVVGLTGVGKTTVIDNAIENTDSSVEYLSHGTLLLEEGKERGLVDDRDDITDLEPSEYDDLQSYTAERIADIASDGPDETTYVLDTHATLATPYGYRPGLSLGDIEIIDPDQFIVVHATPGEVQNRRRNDESRNRDEKSALELREQQNIAINQTATFSAVNRAPVALIENSDGELSQAVAEVVPLLNR